MVYEENDCSSDDSYSGGFEFRRRKKHRHEEEAFKMQTIVISDSYTETEQAFEESIDKTKTVSVFSSLLYVNVFYFYK